MQKEAILAEFSPTHILTLSLSLTLSHSLPTRILLLPVKKQTNNQSIKQINTPAHHHTHTHTNSISLFSPDQ